MNRYVFRARRNECRVDAAVTADGRLFHTLAAATRNARSPGVRASSTRPLINRDCVHA